MTEHRINDVRIYGIVETDNYGGDYPDEKFVAQCWLRKGAAETIAQILNDEIGKQSSRFYKVVERGYSILPGFEP